MPVDIFLDESGDFIDSHYYDHVTFDDIQHLNDITIKLLEESSRDKLHLIMDVSDVKSHPTNIAKTWKIASGTTRHKKLGSVIVVGLDNPVTKLLIDIIAIMGKKILKTASTREKALSFLATIE